MEKTIINQLPKVELHCHLDGSVPLPTLRKFAKEADYAPGEIEKALAPEKCLNLQDYLDSFDVILPLLQTAENLEKATYDTIAAIAADNVSYVELRFAPPLHTRGGLTIHQVLDAVIRGLESGMADFPIKVNLLISAMRHHTEAANLALVEQIKTYNNPFVVGFDFAGDEKPDANKEIGTVVTAAKNANLQLTLHSGECNCPHNVVDAIHLGATRIGHGVAIRNDKSVRDLCREQNVLLEVAPTSNVQTDAVATLADYPLRLFIDENVPCCVNTDNRTVSNTTLSEEYLLMAEYCNLTYAEMKKLNMDAMAHSFATTAIKQTITEQLEKAYAPYLD